jgi:Protein of unknown function (DUF2845)
MRIIVGLCLVILLSLSSAAYGFRCGTNIVNVGDNKLQVLQKCGEPTYKELIKTDGFIVEKWYYDCGSQRFIQTLTFSGGYLQVIEAGDYGKGPDRCQ